MEDPRRLRELAAWYREFAERAGDPAIWDARLRKAEDLERKADRSEKRANRGQAGPRNGAVDQGRESID